MLSFHHGLFRAMLHSVLAIGLGCFPWCSFADGQLAGGAPPVGSVDGVDVTPDWLPLHIPPSVQGGSAESWSGVDAAGPEEPSMEGIELPELIDPRELRTIDGSQGGLSTEDACVPRSRRFSDYRQNEGILSYMPGDGDQFGWIDFEDTPYIHRGKKSGWTSGIGLHLLSGPNSVALPPCLWDFILGYQVRDTISDRFSYDLGATVGVYSDFEDSARDGVRFPGHAVGIVHMNDALDLVGGVDYLDRDDYKILPVIGYSWHSENFPNWNVDMVFPRPRVQFAVNGSERLYVGGLLGGGTWDIEMPGDVNDVMTYRDFRLLFGHEQLKDDGSVSGFELGYVFGRKVEFRSSPQDYTFDDAFIIRWVRCR